MRFQFFGRKMGDPGVPFPQVFPGAMDITSLRYGEPRQLRHAEVALSEREPVLPAWRWEALSFMGRAPQSTSCRKYLLPYFREDDLTVSCRRIVTSLGRSPRRSMSPLTVRSSRRKGRLVADI